MSSAWSESPSSRRYVLPPRPSSSLALRFGCRSIPRTCRRVPTPTMSSATASRTPRRACGEIPRSSRSEPRCTARARDDSLLRAGRRDEHAGRRIAAKPRAPGARRLQTRCRSRRGFRARRRGGPRSRPSAVPTRVPRRSGSSGRSAGRRAAARPGSRASRAPPRRTAARQPPHRAHPPGAGPSRRARSPSASRVLRDRQQLRPGPSARRARPPRRSHGRSRART